MQYGIKGGRLFTLNREMGGGGFNLDRETRACGAMQFEEENKGGGHLI